MESHAATAVTSRVASGPSVFARNQFLIKRLFSLSGLFFSGYVVVHLTTNASLLAGPRMFQENVNRIHSLGPALPFVEWTFLFLPFLFHMIVGWTVILGAAPNLSDYRYVGNIRYTLQRVTAIILFFFVLGHVAHMHHYGKVVGGGLFKPEGASSSLGAAMQSGIWIPLLYAIGVLAAAFHVGNGIWTAGIAWGLWTTPTGQKRANAVACVVGIGIALMGSLAIMGARNVDVEQAESIEKVLVERQQWLLGEEANPASKPDASPAK